MAGVKPSTLTAMLDVAMDRFRRQGYAEASVKNLVAPLRAPARSHLAAAVYRSVVMPELLRIMRGAYRGTRVSTPTRVLSGAEDPALRPSSSPVTSPYVDDLKVEFVEGATHFIADERPDVVVERALGLFTPSPGEGSRGAAALSEGRGSLAPSDEEAHLRRASCH